MVLVDTSIWVDYIRSGSAQLAELLQHNQVLVRETLLGEIACGSLRQRADRLEILGNLPHMDMAAHAEVLVHLLERVLVPFRVHAHERAELYEAWINTAHITGVRHRHVADQAHITRVVPVGDVYVVVLQQRARGLAQQRRKVPRQRRDQQYRGLESLFRAWPARYRGRGREKSRADRRRRILCRLA